jgi:hypothetical protein
VNTTLFLASLVLASPDLTPAAAATPATTTIAAVETSGWYGQPAAIIDGASIALVATGVALGEGGGSGSSWAGTLALLGAGGFLLGGPINHGHNEHYGLAAASVGLRLAATVTTVVVIGIHDLHSCTDDYHQPGCGKLDAGELAGIALPLVAAAVLDDFVLARGTIPVRAPAPTGPTITPAAGPDWAMLSVGGRF